MKKVLLTYVRWIRSASRKIDDSRLVSSWLVAVLAIVLPYAALLGLALFLADDFVAIWLESGAVTAITTGLVGIAVRDATRKEIKAGLLFAAVSLSFFVSQLLILEVPAIRAETISEPGLIYSARAALLAVALVIAFIAFISDGDSIERQISSAVSSGIDRSIGRSPDRLSSRAEFLGAAGLKAPEWFLSPRVNKGRQGIATLTLYSKDIDLSRSDTIASLRLDGSGDSPAKIDAAFEAYGMDVQPAEASFFLPTIEQEATTIPVVVTPFVEAGFSLWATLYCDGDELVTLLVAHDAESVVDLRESRSTTDPAEQTVESNADHL